MPEKCTEKGEMANDNNNKNFVCFQDKKKSKQKKNRAFKLGAD